MRGLILTDQCKQHLRDMKDVNAQTRACSTLGDRTHMGRVQVGFIFTFLLSQDTYVIHILYNAGCNQCARLQKDSQADWASF
jgi:hypothetical protein